MSWLISCEVCVFSPPYASTMRFKLQDGYAAFLTSMSLLCVEIDFNLSHFGKYYPPYFFTIALNVFIFTLLFFIKLHTYSEK